ncbi:MAG: hypothetical protein WCO82_10785 [Sphingomonadales bacterium]
MTKDSKKQLVCWHCGRPGVWEDHREFQMAMATMAHLRGELKEPLDDLLFGHLYEQYQMLCCSVSIKAPPAVMFKANH